MSSDSNDEYLNQVEEDIRAQARQLGERPLLERLAPAMNVSAATSDAVGRDRLDYPIGELTDPHDAAFVRNAFRSILKRTPESTETEAQLRLLATGASKPELLGNLRWSPEGRRVGVRVNGLLPRYVSAKLRRLPVVGYALDWALSLAALPMLARHQRASDALFAAANTTASAANEALSARVAALDRDTAALRQQLAEAQATTQTLQAAQHAYQAVFQQTSDALHGRIGTLENTTSMHAGRLDELAFLRQRVYAMNHWAHNLDGAFAQIEAVAVQRRMELDRFGAQAALQAVDADPSRAARNRALAESFIAQLPPAGTVLALAGGGDWPALLSASGYRTCAAESNPTLAEAMRAQGVAVDPVDAREALRSAADASLDGLSVLALPTLTSSLPLMDLLNEARRVLRDDGVLLLACAREAVALVDGLPEATTPSLDMEALAQFLALAGFSAITRLDSADQTAALLARRVHA